jgi:hypothetical protein
MERSMEVPEKTKNRTTIRSSDTIPGHISEECKSGYNKDTGTLKFIAALFTTAKLWKQSRCPTTDGLRKCGIYT